MAIDLELRNKIRRLYFVEHFTINGIATSLALHHETVKNAIEYQNFSRKKGGASIWDPYRDLINQKLELYPKLTCTRLFQILRDRDAKGSIDSLRRFVVKIRPKFREAYLKRSPMPAEEGQVDWAHFGSIRVGQAERKLYLFVMVLSWSRKAFAKFTFDLKTETFLSCHTDAFKYFAGVPRVILYDNLKSIVIERYGDAVRFNQKALEFSGYYHYELRPCNVYRGNEKGIVERKIRFIRENFFAARNLSDIDTLNQELSDWLENVANIGPWPDNRDFTIGDKFIEEQPKLLTLPVEHTCFEFEKTVYAGKYCHIKFDLNYYSIPHLYVQRPLKVLADQKRIRIYAEGKLISEHLRSWDKNKKFFQKEHTKDLIDYKKRAATGILKHHLLQQCPEVEAIIRYSADHGEPLKKLVQKLSQLCFVYGLPNFQAAIQEATCRKLNSLESIELLLRRQETDQKSSPTIPLSLPNNPKVMGLEISSHDLAGYDKL